MRRLRNANTVSRDPAFTPGDGQRIIRILFMMPLFMLLLFSQGLLAQEGERTIRGTVEFEGTGETVPGANVLIKGTTRGTITDLEGKFEIKASSGEVMVIKFLGYAEQEIKIGTENSYSISLKEDLTQLDEVVKIGYGTMRRSDLTGSVVSVSSEDIQAASATSFDQVLQGRASGVLVTQNSGQPGGGVSVQIRGINSLNGDSEPLYIVDGIPIRGYTGDNTNALATINPNDIESIEVLKDASSTAIYGTQASNGVVIISTKRGKKGETQVSYDGSYALQQLPKYLDVLNLQQYAEFVNDREAIIGFGSKPEFADPGILGEGTNWQAELFRTAPKQSHNISVSGGDEKTTYMLSGGLLDDNGIIIGSNFKRYSASLNVDTKARDWLMLGASSGLSRTSELLTVSDNDIINIAIRQAPDIPVYNEDGTWGGPPDEEEFGVSNPIAEAMDRENIKNRTQIRFNLYGEVRLWKGLTFRSEYGANIDISKTYQFTPKANYGGYELPVNSSTRSAGQNTFWILSNRLQFHRTFAEKHDFSIMLVQEAQENVYESVTATRENFLTNNIHEVNAGDIETSLAYSTKSESALASYFGRVHYTYDSRYSITATMRADGSSKFGENNKWGYFPSVAAYWRLDEEAFMKDIQQVTMLKIRASYGEVGNQNIGNYAYGSTMTNWPTAYGPGFLLTNLPNPNVKWESQREYNIGLDLTLFRNRIELIAEVYHKETDDLLLALPMPLYTATDLDWTVAYIQPPYVNIGSLKNEGIDLMLNTVNIEGAFTWKTGITFTMSRNEITQLVTSGSIIDESIGVETITRTVVGEPAGLFYGYLTDGYFENGAEVLEGVHTAGAAIATDPSTSVWVGDIRYMNLDGNDSITEADKDFIGNPQPIFSFGITNSFYYKNFDLMLTLGGTYGNKIFNQVRRYNENPMSRWGMLASVEDYAELGLIDPEGSADDIENVYLVNPDATVPRIVTSDPNDNMRISDRYIEDGSYLRIKNLSLGYSLPTAVATYLKMSSLRVYVQFLNLYTFTNYTGYDPEIGAQRQNVLKSGVDEGRYPSPRVYQAGINIKF
ncbi:MAG: TonB-dependent receptor [Bacteroidales bacterium]|nr:TonB-dependent receptor [Bacteroidales bacterium]